MGVIALAEHLVYECHNPQCTLGSRKEPGHFAGGMSVEALEALYGTNIYLEEYCIENNIGWGEGYCPNCGTKGTVAVDENNDPMVHESVEGNDPNQHIHDLVKEKVFVGDIKPEKAQEEFEALLETSTSE